MRVLRVSLQGALVRATEDASAEAMLEGWTADCLRALPLHDGLPFLPGRQTVAHAQRQRHAAVWCGHGMVCKDTPAANSCGGSGPHSLLSSPDRTAVLSLRVTAIIRGAPAGFPPRSRTRERSAVPSAAQHRVVQSMRAIDAATSAQSCAEQSNGKRDPSQTAHCCSRVDRYGRHWHHVPQPWS